MILKEDPKSIWRSLKGMGMPSKKDKVSVSNTGFNIDVDKCFDKYTLA